MRGSASLRGTMHATTACHRLCGFGRVEVGYGHVPRGTTADPSREDVERMTSETTSMNSTGGGTTDEARSAAQDVAGTAKEQATQVTGETKRQARQLFDQSREELRSQGSQQQSRLASTLRDLGSELSAMADGPDQGGKATGLVRDVGDQVSSAAQWLENREPGEVLEELRGFARRRPGTFLLLAAGLGVVGGRLTRGAVDEARDSSESSGSGGTGQGYAGTTTSTYADGTTPYAGGTAAYAGGTTAYVEGDTAYASDATITGGEPTWTGDTRTGDIGATDPTSGRDAGGLSPRMPEGEVRP